MANSKTGESSVNKLISNILFWTKGIPLAAHSITFNLQGLNWSQTPIIHPLFVLLIAQLVDKFN